MSSSAMRSAVLGPQDTPDTGTRQLRQHPRYSHWLGTRAVSKITFALLNISPVR